MLKLSLFSIGTFFFGYMIGWLFSESHIDCMCDGFLAVFVMFAFIAVFDYLNVKSLGKKSK